MSAPDDTDPRLRRVAPLPARLDAGFPAPPRETLYARIADHLRGLIESQHFQPGEQLPTERELAQTLGVSRVPIREAMRTLAAQGLVEIRRGRGMFVSSRALEATIDQLATALLKQRDAFKELFAVRRLLEPAATRWAAASAQPPDAARLGRLVADMEAAGAVRPPDLETIGERDVELHVQIAVCADNRVLVRIMQAIQDLHREQLETSQRYEGRVPETLKDHRRIVDAIVAGDAVGAEAAMIAHLVASEAATLRRIEGLEAPTASLPPIEGTD